MNELRAQCRDWLAQEAFYESSGPWLDECLVCVSDTLQGITGALEDFAREQRIQALQTAKRYIRKRVQDRNEIRHWIEPAHQNRDSIRNCEIQIMEKWLDAEIQRMREEGE